MLLSLSNFIEKNFSYQIVKNDARVPLLHVSPVTSGRLTPGSAAVRLLSFLKVLSNSNHFSADDLATSCVIDPSVPLFLASDEPPFVGTGEGLNTNNNTFN